MFQVNNDTELFLTGYSVEDFGEWMSANPLENLRPKETDTWKNAAKLRIPEVQQVKKLVKAKVSKLNTKKYPRIMLPVPRSAEGTGDEWRERGYIALAARDAWLAQLEAHQEVENQGKPTMGVVVELLAEIKGKEAEKTEILANSTRAASSLRRESANVTIRSIS